MNPPHAGRAASTEHVFAVPENTSMRPILYTSIPPRERGLDRGFADGVSPQALAIRSWLEAGFRPVSIHLAREIDREPWLPDSLRAASVECLVIDAVESDAGGPPLCPIVDLLQAVQRHAGDAPVAIINADIRIAGSLRDGPAEQMASLAHDAFLIGQRTDVSRGRDGGTHEATFPHGFDFLAFRPQSIDRACRFLSPSLAFGRPWWDHFVPLALIASGVRPRLVDASRLRHDVHDNRWNARHYRSVGRLASGRFLAEASRLEPPDVADRWIRATNAAFGGFVPGSCVAALRRLALHDAAPSLLAVSFLKRLAAANVAMIVASAEAPLPSAAAAGGRHAV